MFLVVLIYAQAGNSHKQLLPVHRKFETVTWRLHASGLDKKLCERIAENIFNYWKKYMKIIIFL